MLTTSSTRVRPALERGVRLPSLWVVLFFVSSFRLTGSRDPSLASSGVASIENMVELAVYGLAGLLTLPYLVIRGSRRRTMGVAILLAYAALATASATWSKIPLFSAVRGGQVLVLALVVHATVEIWRRDVDRAFRDWRRIWMAYLVVSGLVTALAVTASPAARFAWPGQHPISTAAFLAVASLVAASFALESVRILSNRGRLLAASAATVFGAAVFLTVTRSAMVSFLLALLVLFLSATRLRAPDRLFLALCVGVILATIVLIWPSETLGFVLRGGDVQTLTTFTGRTILWGHAIDALTDSPLVGFGFGSSRLVLLERIPWAGEGHNLWIEAAMGLGLLGVLTITLVLGWLVANALRPKSRARPHAHLVLALSALMVVYGVAASSIARPGLLLTIACLAIAWMSVDSARLINSVRSMRRPEGEGS